MDPLGMLVAALVAAAAMGGVFALQSAIRRRRLRFRPPLAGDQEGSAGAQRPGAQWTATQLSSSRGTGPMGRRSPAKPAEVDWDAVFRRDVDAQQSPSDRGPGSRG